LSGGVAGVADLRFAKLQELLPGSKGGSLDGRGVTLQGVEGSGSGGVVAEGGDHHGVGIVGSAAGDHVLNGLGFQAAGAGETPAELGHFLNEETLVGVSGIEGAVVFGISSSNSS
jgi:hypothetical protein